MAMNDWGFIKAFCRSFGSEGFDEEIPAKEKCDP